MIKINSVKKVPSLIVAAKNDLAGMNIADKLINNFGFKYKEKNNEMKIFVKNQIHLLEIDSDVLELKELDRYQPNGTIICISRHSSETGRASLTVHTPGNLGLTADFGGTPRTLAIADPQKQKLALQELRKNTIKLGLKFSVSMEATHHGPTRFTVPTLFIEIGSKIENWINPLAGEAAASAAWKTATQSEKFTSAVGFGGGHYSPKHTVQMLNGKFALGHILPDYFFEYYDSDIVTQAFQKTKGICKTAIIDWKGLKASYRKILMSTLEKLGKDIVKI
ncbi:D-aminoacyl-tRNA deacylase [[Eubacterium] cellulosolvens]